MNGFKKIYWGSFERNIKRKFISSNWFEKNYLFDNKRLLATLHLLNSSTLVSFSGALRIYLALLLLNAHISLLTCFAGGLIIYTVYTLDRTLDSDEDAVNRSELGGAYKKVAFLVSLAAFIVGTSILIMKGLYLIPFLPFITGYLYSKGLKVGGYSLKLKGGLGVKNLVVGLTWGVFITGIAGISINSLIPLFFVFIYFSSKLFINSTMFDFKDAKGDAMAGIKTLPLALGEKKARNLLLALQLMSHMGLFVAVMFGYIAFEPVILIYSFIIGILYIREFSNPAENEPKRKRFKRLFMIDGESTTIVSFQAFIGILFP